MDSLFNKKGQNGVYLSSKYFQSLKSNKFRSIYDGLSDNTIVMLELDRATVYEAKDFYIYVHELIENDKVRIIIDMENVYFLDSVFFGTLIKLLKEANKKMGYIKLILDYNSKPSLLSISNFEAIFEIFPNLFEAVNKNKVS